MLQRAGLFVLVLSLACVSYAAADCTRTAPVGGTSGDCAIRTANSPCSITCDNANEAPFPAQANCDAFGVDYDVLQTCVPRCNTPGSVAHATDAGTCINVAPGSSCSIKCDDAGEYAPFPLTSTCNGASSLFDADQICYSVVGPLVGFNAGGSLKDVQVGFAYTDAAGLVVPLYPIDVSHAHGCTQTGADAVKRCVYSGINGPTGSSDTSYDITVPPTQTQLSLTYNSASSSPATLSFESGSVSFTPVVYASSDVKVVALGSGVSVTSVTLTTLLDGTITFNIKKRWDLANIEWSHAPSEIASLTPALQLAATQATVDADGVASARIPMRHQLPSKTSTQFVAGDSSNEYYLNVNENARNYANSDYGILLHLDFATENGGAATLAQRTPTFEMYDENGVRRIPAGSSTYAVGANGYDYSEADKTIYRWAPSVTFLDGGVVSGNAGYKSQRPIFISWGAMVPSFSVGGALEPSDAYTKLAFVLKVNSPLDGQVYTIHISNDFDVTDVKFTTAAAESAQHLVAPYAPEFYDTQHGFAARPATPQVWTVDLSQTCPTATESCTIYPIVSFFTPFTLTADINGGATISLQTKTELGGGLVVPTGTSTLRLRSSVDDVVIYTFLLVRPTSFQTLSVRVFNAADSESYTLMLTPTFSPAFTSYQATLAGDSVQSPITNFQVSVNGAIGGCAVAEQDHGVTLLPGYNKITCNSPTGTVYTVEVYRPYELASISFGATDADSQSPSSFLAASGPSFLTSASAPSGLLGASLSTNPSYFAGQMNTMIVGFPGRNSVAHVINAVTMTIGLFESTLASPLTVTVTTTTGAPVVATIAPVNAATQTHVIALAVGTNTVTVSHPKEGTYTFEISRAAQTLTKAVFEFALGSDVTGATAAPLSFTQVITPGTYVYDIPVRHPVVAANFAAFYDDENVFYSVARFTSKPVYPATAPALDSGLMYLTSSSVERSIPTPLFTLTRPTSTDPTDRTTIMPTDRLLANQLTFTTSHDGAYIFRLVVSPPDVAMITMRNVASDVDMATDIASTLSVSAANPYVLVPPFQPGVYAYSVIVADRVIEVSAEVEYSSANTVTVSGASIGAAPVSISTFPGLKTSTRPSVGATSVQVVSTLDGTYTITVLRTSDLSEIQFNRLTVDYDNNFGGRATSPVPLLFKPGTFEYDIYLEYAYDNVDFSAAFLTPNSIAYDFGQTESGIRIDASGRVGALRYTEAEAVANPNLRDQFFTGKTLRPIIGNLQPQSLTHTTPTQMRFLSEVDGIYTFNIYRAAAKLVSIVVAGVVTSTSQNGVAPIAVAGTVASPGKLYEYNNAGTGTVLTSFTRTRNTYSVTLPSVAEALSVTPTFPVGTTVITATIEWFKSFLADTTLMPAVDAGAAQTSSTLAAGRMGTNTLYILSATATTPNVPTTTGQAIALPVAPYQNTKYRISIKSNTQAFSIVTGSAGADTINGVTTAFAVAADVRLVVCEFIQLTTIKVWVCDSFVQTEFVLVNGVMPAIPLRRSPVHAMSTVVSVFSSHDGGYIYDVTVLPQELSAFTFQTVSAQAAQSGIAIGFGGFVAGQRLYTTAGTIDAAVDSVNLNSFVYANGGETFTYSSLDPAFTTGVVPNFSLRPGVNRITIATALDGIYTFVLNKAVQTSGATVQWCDFRHLTGSTCSQPQSMTSITDFGASLTYALTLPYRAYAIAVTTIGSGAPVLTMQTLTPSVTSVAITSGTAFTPIPTTAFGLVNTAQVVIVDTYTAPSTAGDVTYTITVTRTAPVVTASLATAPVSGVFASVPSYVYSPLHTETASSYDIPYAQKIARMTFTFSSGTVTNFQVKHSSIGVQVALATVVSGTPIEFHIDEPGLVASYHVSWDSSEDGIYSDLVELKIATPDLSAIHFPIGIFQPSAGSFFTQRGGVAGNALYLTNSQAAFYFQFNSLSLGAGVVARYNGVTLTRDTATGTSLMFGTAGAPIPALVGTSTITIDSPLDGLYTITILRSPDLVGVLFSVSSVNSAPIAGSLADVKTEEGDLVPFPAFNAAVVMTYRATVPFRWTTVQARVDFLSTSGNAVTVSGTAGSMPNGGASKPISLVVGTTTVTVTSPADDGAVYTFILTREPANFQSIVLANADIPAQSTVSKDLAGKFFWEYFSPASEPNLATTTAYTASVPYSVRAITIRATFTNTGTNRVTYSRVEDGIANELLTTQTVTVPLYVGSNSIQVTDLGSVLTDSSVQSGDGAYTFLFTRAAATVSGITLTASAPNGVTMKLNPISAAPTSIPFTSGFDRVMLSSTTGSGSYAQTVSAAFNSVSAAVTVSSGATSVEWTCNAVVLSIATPCPLKAGVNRMVIGAADDGAYSFVITRETDVKQLVFQSLPTIATTPLIECVLAGSTCVTAARSLRLTDAYVDGASTSLGFNQHGVSDMLGFTPATADATYRTIVPYNTQFVTVSPVGNADPIQVDAVQDTIGSVSQVYASLSTTTRVYNDQVQNVAAGRTSTAFPLTVGDTTLLRVQTAQDDGAAYLAYFQRLKQSVTKITITPVDTTTPIGTVIDTVQTPNVFDFTNSAYNVGYGVYAVRVTVDFNAAQGDSVSWFSAGNVGTNTGLGVPDVASSGTVQNGVPFTVYLKQSAFVAYSENPTGVSPANDIYITSTFDNVGLDTAAARVDSDAAFYRVRINRASANLGAVQMLPYVVDDGEMPGSTMHDGIITDARDNIVSLGSQTNFVPVPIMLSDKNVYARMVSSPPSSTFGFEQTVQIVRDDLAIGLSAQDANHFYYRLRSKFNAVAISAHTGSKQTLTVTVTDSVGVQQTYTFVPSETFSGFVPGGGANLASTNGQSPIIGGGAGSLPAVTFETANYAVVYLTTGLNEITVSDPTDGSYKLFVYKEPDVRSITFVPLTPDLATNLAQATDETIPHGAGTVTAPLRVLSGSELRQAFVLDTADGSYSASTFTTTQRSPVVLSEPTAAGATPAAWAKGLKGNAISFSAQVPYSVTRVRLDLDAQYLQSGVDVNGGVATLVPFDAPLSGATGTTGPVTGRANKQAIYSLPVGSTVFHIANSFDGVYTIVLTRLAPDLTLLDFQAKPIATQTTLSPIDLAAQFAPPLVSGGTLFDYTVEVPSAYATFTFTPQTTVGTTTVVTAFSTNIAEIASVTNGLVLVNRVPVSFELATGANRFTIFDDADGAYTFNIVRRDVDVQRIEIQSVSTGIDAMGALVSPATTQQFGSTITRNFLPILSGSFTDYEAAIVAIDTAVLGPLVPTTVTGQNEHVYTVPLADIDRVLELSFSVAFLTRGAASISINGGSPVVLTSTGYDSIVVPVPSSGAKTTVQLMSSMDGVYTFEFLRSADLSLVTLSQFYNIAGENIAGDLVANPVPVDAYTFAAARTTPYEITVPYSTGAISFIPTFFTGPVTLQYGVNTAVLTSLVPSVIMPLAVGANTITITSPIDGTYTYMLTRSEPRITDIRLLSATGSVVPGADFVHTQRTYTAAVSGVVSPVRLVVDFTGEAGLIEVLQYQNQLQVSAPTEFVVNGVPTKSYIIIQPGLGETKLVVRPVGAQSAYPYSSPNDGEYSYVLTVATPAVTQFYFAAVTGAIDIVGAVKAVTITSAQVQTVNQLTMTRDSTALSTIPVGTAFASSIFYPNSPTPLPLSKSASVWVTTAQFVAIGATFTSALGTVSVSVNGGESTLIRSGLLTDTSFPPPLLYLPVGRNIITVTSSVDGTYSFVLDRNSQFVDIELVPMTRVGSVGTMVNDATRDLLTNFGSSLSTQSTDNRFGLRPYAFTPATYFYEWIVGYGVTAFAALVTVTESRGNDVRTFPTGGNFNGQEFTAAAGGVITQIVPSSSVSDIGAGLNVSTTVFSVRFATSTAAFRSGHEELQVYSFSITRLPIDVQDLQVSLYNAIDGAFTSAQMTFDHAVTTYTLTVPFSTTQVRTALVFNTPATVSVAYEKSVGTGAKVAAPELQSLNGLVQVDTPMTGVPTTFDLSDSTAPLINNFFVTYASSLDGFFTVAVQRLAQNLRAVGFKTTPDNSGFTCTGSGPSYTNANLCTYASSTYTVSSVPIPSSSSVAAQIPSITVAKATTSVTLALSFSLAEPTLAITVNGAIVATPTPTNSAGVVTYSVTVAVLPGTNTVHVRSQADGEYTYVIMQPVSLKSLIWRAYDAYGGVVVLPGTVPCDTPVSCDSVDCLSTTTPYYLIDTVESCAAAARNVYPQAPEMPAGCTSGSGRLACPIPALTFSPPLVDTSYASAVSGTRSLTLPYIAATVGLTVDMEWTSPTWSLVISRGEGTAPSSTTTVNVKNTDPVYSALLIEPNRNRLATGELADSPDFLGSVESTYVSVPMTPGGTVSFKFNFYRSPPTMTMMSLSLTNPFAGDACVSSSAAIPCTVDGTLTIPSPDLLSRLDYPTDVINAPAKDVKKKMWNKLALPALGADAICDGTQPGVCIAAGAAIGASSTYPTNAADVPARPNRFDVVYPNAFRSASLRLEFSSEYVPIVEYTLAISSIAVPTDWTRLAPAADSVSSTTASVQSTSNTKTADNVAYLQRVVNLPALPFDMPTTSYMRVRVRSAIDGTYVFTFKPSQRTIESVNFKFVTSPSVTDRPFDASVLLPGVTTMIAQPAGTSSFTVTTQCRSGCPSSQTSTDKLFYGYWARVHTNVVGHSLSTTMPLLYNYADAGQSVNLVANVGVTTVQVVDSLDGIYTFEITRPADFGVVYARYFAARPDGTKDVATATVIPIYGCNVAAGCSTGAATGVVTPQTETPNHSVVGFQNCLPSSGYSAVGTSNTLVAVTSAPSTCPFSTYNLLAPLPFKAAFVELTIKFTAATVKSKYYPTGATATAATCASTTTPNGALVSDSSATGNTCNAQETTYTVSSGQQTAATATMPLTVGSSNVNRFDFSVVEGVSTRSFSFYFPRASNGLALQLTPGVSAETTSAANYPVGSGTAKSAGFIASVNYNSAPFFSQATAKTSVPTYSPATAPTSLYKVVAVYAITSITFVATFPGTLTYSSVYQTTALPVQDSTYIVGTSSDALAIAGSFVTGVPTKIELAPVVSGATYSQTRITLTSDTDGTVTYVINRAAPALTGLSIKSGTTNTPTDVLTTVASTFKTGAQSVTPISVAQSETRLSASSNHTKPFDFALTAPYLSLNIFQSTVTSGSLVAFPVSCTNGLCSNDNVATMMQPMPVSTVESTTPVAQTLYTQTGANLVRYFSVLDGVYVFPYTRAGSTLVGLDVTPKTATGQSLAISMKASSSYANAQLLPGFIPGLYSYDMNLPYAATSIELIGQMASASGMPTITTQFRSVSGTSQSNTPVLTGSTFAAVSYPLTTASATGPIAYVEVTVSALDVPSTNGGSSATVTLSSQSYVVFIYRAVPTISSISIYALSGVGNGVTQLLTSGVTFAAATNEYTINLGQSSHAISSIAVVASFSVHDTVSVVAPMRPKLRDTQTDPITPIVSLQSMLLSEPINLASTQTDVTVYSTRDGPYVFHINRGADVSGIAFAEYRLEAAVTNGETRQVSPLNFGTFVPGTIATRTSNVGFRTSSVRLTAAFVTVGTAYITVNGGAVIELTTGVESVRIPLAAPETSPATTGYEPTTIVVSSHELDGDYTYVINRAARDVGAVTFNFKLADATAQSSRTLIDSVDANSTSSVLSVDQVNYAIGHLAGSSNTSDLITKLSLTYSFNNAVGSSDVSPDGGASVAVYLNGATIPVTGTASTTTVNSVPITTVTTADLPLLAGVNLIRVVSNRDGTSVVSVYRPSSIGQGYFTPWLYSVQAKMSSPLPTAAPFILGNELIQSAGCPALNLESPSTEPFLPIAYDVAETTGPAGAVVPPFPCLFAGRAPRSSAMVGVADFAPANTDVETITVPFSTVGLRFVMYKAVPFTSSFALTQNGQTLSLDAGTFPATTIVVPKLFAVDFVTLVPGANTFTLKSSVEPLAHAFTVTRASADLTNLQVFTQAANFYTGAPTPTQRTFMSAFSALQNTYSATTPNALTTELGYGHRQIQVVASWTSTTLGHTVSAQVCATNTTSCLVTPIALKSGQSQTITLPSNSGVYSTDYVVSFISSLDGEYSVFLTRAAAPIDTFTSVDYSSDFTNVDGHAVTDEMPRVIDSASLTAPLDGIGAMRTIAQAAVGTLGQPDYLPAIAADQLYPQPGVYLYAFGPKTGASPSSISTATVVFSLNSAVSNLFLTSFSNAAKSVATLAVNTQAIGQFNYTVVFGSATTPLLVGDKNAMRVRTANLQDTQFEFRMNKPAALTSVSVYSSKANGAAALTLSPPFSAGFGLAGTGEMYTITVPFLALGVFVGTVAADHTFTTARFASAAGSGLGPFGAIITDTTTNAAVWPVSGASIDHGFLFASSLQQGTSYLQVGSAYDNGVGLAWSPYVFMIVKQAPDIASSGIIVQSIEGVQAITTIASTSVPVAIPSMTFTPLQHDYYLRVRNAVTAVRVASSFGTPGSIMVYRDDASSDLNLVSSAEALVTSTVADVNAGTPMYPSNPLLLIVGINVIRVASSLDETYTYYITREGDVLDVTFRDSKVNPTALALLTGTKLQPIVPLFSSGTTYDKFVLAQMGVNPVTGATLTSYVLTLPYMKTQITMAIEYQSGDVLTVTKLPSTTVTGTIVTGPTIATAISANYLDAYLLQLSAPAAATSVLAMSPIQSTSFEVQTGPNQEGRYDFTIYVLAADIKTLDVLTAPVAAPGVAGTYTSVPAASAANFAARFLRGVYSYKTELGQAKSPSQNIYTRVSLSTVKRSSVSNDIAAYAVVPVGTHAAAVLSTSITIRAFGPDGVLFPSASFTVTRGATPSITANTEYDGIPYTIDFAAVPGLNTIIITNPSDTDYNGAVVCAAATPCATEYVMQFNKQTDLIDVVLEPATGVSQTLQGAVSAFVPGDVGPYKIEVSLITSALRLTGRTFASLSKADVTMVAIASPTIGKPTCADVSRTALKTISPVTDGTFTGSQLSYTADTSLVSTGSYTFLDAAARSALAPATAALLAPTATGVTCYLATITDLQDFPSGVPFTYIITRLGPTVIDVIFRSRSDALALIQSPVFVRGELNTITASKLSHPQAPNTFTVPFFARRSTIKVVEVTPLPAVRTVKLTGTALSAALVFGANAFLDVTGYELGSVTTGTANFDLVTQANSNTLNSLSVTSQYDGAYRFDVTVRPPVVTNFVITRYYAAATGRASAPLVVSTVDGYFATGVNTESEIQIGSSDVHGATDYTTLASSNLPFVVDRISVDSGLVVASDPSVTTYLINGVPVNAGQEAKMNVGPNTIFVSNTNDGSYVYTIYRNMPILTSLTLSLDSATPIVLDFKPSFVPSVDANGVARFTSAPESGATELSAALTFFQGAATDVFEYSFSAGGSGTLTLVGGVHTISALTLSKDGDRFNDNTLTITSQADGIYVFTLLGAVVVNIQLSYIDPVTSKSIDMEYTPAFLPGVTLSPHGYVPTLTVPEAVKCIRVGIQYPIITVPGAPTAWLNSNQTLDGEVTLTPDEVGRLSAPICTLQPMTNTLFIDHPIDRIYTFTIYRQPSSSVELTQIAVGSGIVDVPSQLFALATTGALPPFTGANAEQTVTIDVGETCLTVIVTVGNVDQRVFGTLLTSAGVTSTTPNFVVLGGQYAPSAVFASYTQIFCGLTTGANVITVKTVAQDSTVGESVINVFRTLSSNSLLQSIVFYGIDPLLNLEIPATYDRAFGSADSTPYHATLQASFTVGVVVATPVDSKATMKVSAGGAPFRPYDLTMPSLLSEGQTAFLVLVTAEDGSSTLYEIDATRLPAVGGVHYAPGQFYCATVTDASLYSCGVGSLIRINQCRASTGVTLDFNVCREQLGSSGEQVQCFPIRTFNNASFPPYINGGKVANACN